MRTYTSTMEKEIFEQPRVLAEIKEANRVALEALVNELLEVKPNMCYFAARGTSDHASIYASYLLGIVKGIPCGLSLPSVVTVYDGALNLEGCLVIGVSQSGKAKDVLEVLERANQNGAVTVAVTNDKDSPMAKQAKYHLCCAAGEEISVAATKTFTSQMYVLACLVALWSKDEKLNEALDKVPAAFDEMLETTSAALDKIIERYRYMRDGFVLGRGTSYPVALESALKLQETNYVRMKGYATSDFYHGPLAQIEEGTPVILYAAMGPCFENAVDMLTKLEEIGAEVILVSDNYEITKNRKFAFKVPTLGTDLVTPFMFAAFAQLFACKLTTVKGLSPDSPRNLKKVTITI